MVEITIENDRAVFTLCGWDRFFAMKSGFEIPLEQISSVHTEPEAMRAWWHAWRVRGTEVPGVIVAGTFYQSGRRVFYDVHNADKAIVVALDHAKYAELIVEVEDPVHELIKFRAALVAYRNTGSAAGAASVK